MFYLPIALEEHVSGGAETTPAEAPNAMEGLADESKVKAGAADEPEAKAGEEASFPLEVVAANENSVAVPDTEGAGLAFTAEIAAETPLAVEPTQTAGTAASMGKPVAAVVAAEIAA